MYKKTLLFLCWFCLVLLASYAHAEDSTCNTEFTNPFSDVEWSCMYPIRMAGFNITPTGPDPESKVSQALCSCDDGAFKRVGISVGFREPARMLDVVKDSFCLASIGIDMGSSSPWGDGGAIEAPTEGGSNQATYSGHTHYYYFNPFLILEILMDMKCIEKTPLDVASMSEVDPFAEDEELQLLVFAETILFANPVAVLACAADAVSSTLGYPIDALFWCAGTWGTVYPLSNRADPVEESWVQSAALVASKYLARGHRELLNWGTKGAAAMCGAYPQPIWHKSQYKFQFVQPVKMRSCVQIGKSTLLWGQGLNPPVPGKADNFSMIVWRYRDCCAF